MGNQQIKMERTGKGVAVLERRTEIDARAIAVASGGCKEERLRVTSTRGRRTGVEESESMSDGGNGEAMEWSKQWGKRAMSALVTGVVGLSKKAGSLINLAYLSRKAGRSDKLGPFSWKPGNKLGPTPATVGHLDVVLGLSN